MRKIFICHWQPNKLTVHLIQLCLHFTRTFIVHSTFLHTVNNRALIQHEEQDNPFFLQKITLILQKNKQNIMVSLK